MKSNNRIFYFVGALFFFNFFIWAFYFSVKPNDIMKLYFLDIGQGDAIFVVAPNGKQILIDGGKDSGVLRELGRVMGFFDRTIDIMLATHPDQDHIGGLPLVMERYKIGNFIDSVADSDSASYQALENLAKEKNIPTYYGMRGMTIVLDRAHGVYLHVLYPIPDDFKITETNDMSIVAKLVYGDTSVMLTGDAPKRIESMLASTDGAYLQSSILKAGHHGSRTSTSRSFAEATDPRYAVISAGLNNTYGHPHKEVMNILADLHIETLETSKAGTIEFDSNGVDMWLK
jgi:competence protein ComEC